jgi:hypothetical protein
MLCSEDQEQDSWISDTWAVRSAMVDEPAAVQSDDLSLPSQSGKDSSIRSIKHAMRTA